MEKNNRLIAEFMGYALNENDEYPIEYITVQGHWDTCSIQDLNYHKSWDWLMKVVEKILNICAENDDLEKYAVITDNIPYIQQTYDECIKFINFYNKQKEE